MINDINDRAVKEVSRLRKRPYRQSTGLVIVEGYPEVSRAVQAKVPVEVLYICPEIFTPKNDEFKDFTTVEVTKDVFGKMAFGSRLKGILAICKPRKFHLEDIEPKASAFIVIMENVEKPGNLGAVIRSCDGAGVDALIMVDGKTDIYNQHVVRSSIGTIFTVMTVSASREETRDFLERTGINLYAATVKGKNIYTEEDYTGPVAIMVGNEHDGLSPFWLERCRKKVKIPMLGCSGSLNVTVSASILIYEILRQRSLSKK